MKVVKADLLNDVVSSYDQTKTTIQGRVATRTINGNSVLGPPLNLFVDVVADSSALTVPIASYLSPNGRLFSLGAVTTGLAYISLHDINLTTGAKTFVGTIRVPFPNSASTTHSIRSIKAIDTGTTGWKIYISTVGSVTINGGLFCINSVDKVDFIPVGATLFSFATGSNQKAVYFLQDPSNIGVGQLNIASAGMVLDSSANRIYVHNGVSATHQYYVYDTSATLDCPLTTGLSISDVTDRVTHTSHGFADNTPIFLTNLVGGTGLTTNTVYFVRNSTANDYQLSGTTGGVAINITVAGTASISRAFGTTSSAWVHKTGNLPALTGTLLLLDCEDFAQPQHTVNAGFDCAFLATGTNLYLGKLSELTSGAVTWPSLVTSNLLGTSNQIVAPAATIATWSNVLDKAIYVTNANIFVAKQIVNNSIVHIFGGNNNKYRETFTTDVVELGMVTYGALDVENGWLVATGITNTGQRGHIICDLYSNTDMDYSYIVSKVMDSPSSTYKFLTTVDELYDNTGSLKVFYRTSGFGSISGGWTPIDFADDLSGFATGDQVQFKITFDTLGLDTCIHAQLKEFYLGYETVSEISDNWEFSDDYSDNNTPSRVAFRLKKAYSSSVPTLYFRGHDLSDSLLITNDTVTNAASFEYSTDSGTSWNPLGTIPNTVGTLVRYSWTTPPGIDYRPSIREA